MKIGVIGAGAISGIYLSNLTERFGEVEVAGVAARHKERAEQKAAEYGLRAYTVEELLADPEIGMIVNLTPVEAHDGLIRRALEAGKHVYTEKTLTNDLQTSRALIALAEEKGLYLGCAPDTFLGRALQTARAAVDSGRLGDIHSFAISANRNYDGLLSLFAFLREPGTGVLLDYGVYYITALVSLLGPAARVAGFTSVPYPRRRNILPGAEFGQMMDTPNESEVSAVLRLRSGVTGTLHIDAESHAVDQAFFAIYGTKGILYLPDPNQFGGAVRFLPNPADPRAPEAAETLLGETPYADNARGVGAAEMARAIAERRPCRASKEMALHVQEILQAILQSAESGQFVDLASTFERPLPLAPGAQPLRGTE